MAVLLNTRAEAYSESFREKFLTAWARTDEIFDIVPAAGVAAKPIVWRHPFIFYIGHLPAFAWNQICGAPLQWKSFNPYFDDLFCRGVDPDVDTGDCHWHPPVPDAWPSLSETLEYRNKVRAAILEALDVLSPSAFIDVMAQRGRALRMTLEHEYMHQETLLYMLQQFPIEKKLRPTAAGLYSFQPAPRGQSALPEQIRAIESLGPSPMPPWVISRKVAASLRGDVRNLLLCMHGDVNGGGMLARAGLERFVEARDHDYNPIRVMARKAEQFFRFSDRAPSTISRISQSC